MSLYQKSLAQGAPKVLKSSTVFCASAAWLLTTMAWRARKIFKQTLKINRMANVPVTRVRSDCTSSCRVLSEGPEVKSRLGSDSFINYLVAGLALGALVAGAAVLPTGRPTCCRRGITSGFRLLYSMVSLMRL